MGYSTSVSIHKRNLYLSNKNNLEEVTEDTGKDSSNDSTITSMHVEYDGCRGKGMHRGATARISSIEKHFLISMLILGQMVDLATITRQSSRRMEPVSGEHHPQLASDKLRATGTVLISGGDHRYPPFQGHSLVIAASLILSQ